MKTYHKKLVALLMAVGTLGLMPIVSSAAPASIDVVIVLTHPGSVLINPPVLTSAVQASAFMTGVSSPTGGLPGQRIGTLTALNYSGPPGQKASLKIRNSAGTICTAELYPQYQMGAPTDVWEYNQGACSMISTTSSVATITVNPNYPNP